MLTFPAEFASIKPALRAFVATLFEDNPFQFKPIFRGFYITSAIQGNDIKPAINDRILRKFSLQGGGNGQVRAALSHGYFLKELFSKVIFPDRQPRSPAHDPGQDPPAPVCRARRLVLSGAGARRLELVIFQ